jgi:hypothetical protein
MLNTIQMNFELNAQCNSNEFPVSVANFHALHMTARALFDCPGPCTPNKGSGRSTQRLLRAERRLRIKFSGLVTDYLLHAAY